MIQEVRDLASDRESNSPVASSRVQALAADEQPSGAAFVLHVAYLINQYPKVSHSFIRREILALEQQGVTVDRIATRGWDADVVDPADIAELDRTRYVLKDGVLPVLAAALRQCLKQPRSFVAALRTVVVMSRRSVRPLPYHLMYLAQACRIVEWLRETGASHLHAHFGTNPAEVAMLVRLLGGPPYSFTAHGADETDGAATLGFDTKIRHAKYAVAVSSYMRSQLLRRVDPVDWHKIKVVHCGLDSEFLDGSAGTLRPDNRIVCVGRLSSEKGQLVLLEAMADIAERFPSAELVLAGDGDMRAALEQRIAGLGLQARVRVTGWLTSAEVRNEIQAAKVLVVPSLQEGLPIVIMEAMALKRVVIATQVAGIPELVRAGETGWLVPAGSVADLVEAIEACLASPIEDLQRMGDVAYARVSARHSINREAAKLVALFRANQHVERMGT